MLHIFFSVFCLNVLPEAIKPPCLIETHSQSPQDINSNDYNADAAGNLNQLFPKHLNKFTATTKTDTKLWQHCNIHTSGNVDTRLPFAIHIQLHKPHSCTFLEESDT